MIASHLSLSFCQYSIGIVDIFSQYFALSLTKQFITKTITKFILVEKNSYAFSKKLKISVNAPNTATHHFLI